MHALTSVATVPLGRRNSAHKVVVLKAVLTAPTVRLLTVATVLPSPVKTVAHHLSVATTAVAMPPVAVSVVSTVAQPVTVALTATVVHRTVPSTALTAVRKVVALSRVVISRHVAHRPSVLASRHHVAAHLHAENQALLELTGPFGALFFLP
jgi:hypothetical protein